jgi:hypothetical protein
MNMAKRLTLAFLISECKAARNEARKASLDCPGLEPAFSDAEGFFRAASKGGGSFRENFREGIVAMADGYDRMGGWLVILEALSGERK